MEEKAYYKDLSDEQKLLMHEFIISHPTKSLIIDTIKWQYYDSKTDPPILLLLHGAYPDFSMWIHQIKAFETDFRVIAPTCPALPNPTMAVYVQALTTFLYAVGVDRLSVMGYSEGGLIAQCFLREQAQRVEHAILAHTFYPTPENKYYRYDFNLFRILPAPITTWLFGTFAHPDN